MATIDVTDRQIATPGATRHAAEQVDNSTPPIKIWAGLGAVIIAFLAYVIIAWVTGPYFESVPQGPSDTPMWMHVELIAWQVVSIPAALYLIWRFVVKPWRRDKTVGIDGLLVLGGATMWVQDPWSSAGNHWFVYNTDMVNMGSWANDLPWFNAFGEPGAMTSEPILFRPARAGRRGVHEHRDVRVLQRPQHRDRLQLDAVARGPPEALVLHERALR